MSTRTDGRRFVARGTPLGPGTWLTATLLAYVLLGFAEHGRWGGGTGVKVLVDAGWTVAGLMALVACAYAAKRRRGNERVVWAFFALGCLSWLIGQCMWNVYDLVTRFPQSPTLADLGYLGFVPAFIAGFVTSGKGGRMSRLLLLLDICIVAATLAIAVLAVFSADIQSSQLTLTGKATTLLYPVLYATLAFTLLLVSPKCLRRNRSLQLLLAGLMTQVAPFVLWTPMLLRNAYTEGGPLDVIWMVSLVLIAAGAMLADETPEVALDQQVQGMGAITPLLLASAAACLMATEVADASPMDQADRSSLALVAVLVLLTCFRLGLTLWRSRTLLQVAKDSTARVRESEARFRAIFQGAPVGIEIADNQGRLTHTNRVLQDMLGYTQQELDGMDYKAITHPDDIPIEDAMDADMIAGDRDFYQIEKRHIHKDGHAIWTRLTASQSAGPGEPNRFAIGMVEDITEQKKAEEALRRSEQRYRQLAETTPLSICIVNGDGEVLVANNQTSELFGYRNVDEMIGMNFFELVSDGDQERARVDMQTVMAAGTLRNLEYELVTPDGGSFFAEVNASPLLDDSERPSGWINTIQDISARKRSEFALQHQALHDTLTELPNRTLLHARVHQAVQLAQSTGGSFALFLMDLDRFKEVNDTFGHQYGDVLLQHVSRRLQRASGETDLVARLGGDEFAVLVSSGNRLDMYEQAVKLRDVLYEPIVIDGHSMHVDGTIGIALFPDHGEDGSTLLRHADVAMYAAKRMRLGVALYQPEHDQHTPDRLALVSELRHGIEDGQLVLYYQPKMNLRTRRIEHVEALVRWQHPKHGLVPPAHFVPLAEETGLIDGMSLWVIRAALYQARNWRRQGIDVCTAVNLPASSLQDTRVVGLIAKLLPMLGLEGSNLKVEITESTLMSDSRRALRLLEPLHRLGVDISVDDFGTGYSSLAYLKRLPVQEIKIDRSFVTGMESDRDNRAIVRSTINLGHDLGLQVVAEGVETETEMEMLAGMECDVVQGYFISRPLPVAEVDGWLRASAPTPASLRATS